MDRCPIADGLATGRGRIAIERRRQEDRAALRVEVEDLGRIRREAETMVGRPRADFLGAALQDGQVERIDRDFHQDLGTRRG